VSGQAFRTIAEFSVIILKKGIVVRGKAIPAWGAELLCCTVPLYAGGDGGASIPLLGVLLEAGTETAFHFTTQEAPIKIGIDPHMPLIA